MLTYTPINDYTKHTTFNYVLLFHYTTNIVLVISISFDYMNTYFIFVFTVLRVL